jgi:hypothetical protein
MIGVKEISVETQKPLPTIGVISKWLESETAKKTYLTLHAIDLLRHGFDVGFRGGISSLYFDKEIAKLPPKDQRDWLMEQMPIKDIHHAIFAPDINKLVILDVDELNIKRDEAREMIMEEIKVKYGVRLNPTNCIIGTIATVKENELNIFDMIYNANDREVVENSASKLAKQGYLLLSRSFEGKSHPTEGRYVPIIGTPNL